MDKYSLHEVSLSCAEAALKAALFITPDVDKRKASTVRPIGKTAQ